MYNQSQRLSLPLPRRDRIYQWVRGEGNVWAPDGTNVRWVEDASGNGNHFFRESGSAPFMGLGLNGRMSIRFGSSSTMSTLSTFVFPALHELFIVKRSSSGTRVFVHDSGGPSRYIYNGGAPSVYYASGSTTARTATGYTAHPAGVRILSSRYNGAHSDHTLANNGVDYPMTDFTVGSPAGSASTGTLWLFSYLGSSEFLAADLHEWILYDTSGGNALTVEERRAVNRVLADHHGIAGVA